MSTAITTIGVVSDTHVPDRAQELHPALLPALRDAGVSHILHAGDIAVPSVLEELKQVAPVSAVRGNRDWLFTGKLPWSRRLEFGGVPLLLIHGQGNLHEYMIDKFAFYTQGYYLKHYQTIISRSIKTERVVVYGHTHVPENFWQDGRLWFNPGSASIAMFGSGSPSIGLLHFGPDDQVRGEIVLLNGNRLENRHWKRI